MQKKYKQYLIHLGLFLVTFFSTTFAGSLLIVGRSWPFSPFSWSDFSIGMQYSIPFLLILTVHEFGHYFTAKYHKIKTTLPYYIPLPPYIGIIGTMGAVIRIKEFVKSKKQNFDIGISGPLAGYVIAMGFLIYGFTHLPDKDYIFQIHPEYEYFGENYDQYVYTQDTFALKSEIAKLTDQDISYMPDTVRFNTKEQEGLNMAIGSNLTFWFFENYIVQDHDKMPNHYELMHYPILFAAFLALLFTALNLLPIGQLDGGHTVYGLLGEKRSRWVARAVFLAFIFYAGIGIITPYDTSETLMGYPVYGVILIYVLFLFITLKGLKMSTINTLMVALIIFTVQFTLPLLFPTIKGYSGWLFFAFIIGRFLGVYHPRSPIEEPLDTKRKVLGWLALIIFIISFSPTPIVLH